LAQIPQLAGKFSIVFNREELIVADLDFKEIDREAMTLDVSGHYARPDLFRFEKKELA
jgi:hypothetical protein